MKTSGWIAFNDSTNVMDIIGSFQEVLKDMGIDVSYDGDGMNGKIELVKESSYEQTKN